MTVLSRVGRRPAPAPNARSAQGQAGGLPYWLLLLFTLPAAASPIVWGDRIFITTAISSKPGGGFRRGLYGDGDASDDRTVQKWKVLALHRDTGKLLWERLAYEGVPKEKRHIKSTYASSTPATDGEVVVAFFGSQGLYAYDMNGKPLWSRDLGRFNVGAYDAPDYEWGTASSPIVYGDLVIVQCYQQKGSFLMALDRKTGKDLWRVGSSSKITAPTPIYSGNLILVASGRRPEAPIP